MGECAMKTGWMCTWLQQHSSTGSFALPGVGLPIDLEEIERI